MLIASLLMNGSCPPIWRHSFTVAKERLDWVWWLGYYLKRDSVEEDLKFFRANLEDLLTLSASWLWTRQWNSSRGHWRRKAVLIWSYQCEDGMTSATRWRRKVWNSLVLSARVTCPIVYHYYGHNAGVYKYFIEQRYFLDCDSERNGLRGWNIWWPVYEVDVIVTDHHSMRKPFWYTMGVETWASNADYR